MENKKEIFRYVPTEPEWFYYGLDDIIWSKVASLATMNVNEKNLNKRIYLSKKTEEIKISSLKERLECCDSAARKKMKAWIDSGYITEDKKNYYLSGSELYIKINKDIIDYFSKAKSKFSLKVYIFLAWKDKYMKDQFDGRSYNFSIQEILDNLGYAKGQRNSGMEKTINFILNDLESNGIIEFDRDVCFRIDGKTVRKKVLRRIETKELPSWLAKKN